MNKIIAVMIGAFVIVGCAHKTSENKSTFRIGNDLESSRYGTIYFSAQPSDKDFNELKSQGFETIINLRRPTEHDEKTESELVVKLGMTYINIPFSKDMKLSNEYISKVTNEVMKNRKKGKILIHCNSGNRVGIWVGGHFYKDHSYSKDESIKIAMKSGLNKTEAIDKLKEFLNNN